MQSAISNMFMILHHWKTLFVILAMFSCTGCSNVPSTKELDKDISILNKEIAEASKTAQKYSGGLIAALVNVRLETLKSTKAMLEQKEIGSRRYIPISYSVEGKKYSPPKNKDELLISLKHDIDKLQRDLVEADKKNQQYKGGLLGVLVLTQVETIRNSIVFLEQKRLLLKYDIPFYSIFSDASGAKGASFKKTPGKDIDKF